jgi:hypothetical protein
MAFLMKFFLMGKTNALRGRILNFQHNSMETISERGKVSDYFALAISGNVIT